MLQSILNINTVEELFSNEGLTPSKCRVLTLIGQNKTNEQIAKELALAPQTVRNYISSVLLKLGVSDRDAARQLFHSRIQNFGFDLSEI